MKQAENLSILGDYVAQLLGAKRGLEPIKALGLLQSLYCCLCYLLMFVSQSRKSGVGGICMHVTHIVSWTWKSWETQLMHKTAMTPVTTDPFICDKKADAIQGDFLYAQLAEVVYAAMGAVGGG